MKKRFVAIVLISIAALGCLFAFSACTNENNGGEHIHSYTEKVVEPTCTEGGYTLHTCTCGESYIDKVKSAAHDYKNGVCAVCHKQLPTKELKYRLSEDRSFYVVAGIESRHENNVVIADEYEKIPVKAIADNAFLLCSGITSITIPDSVTSIGKWAFAECRGLKSITIPDSVTFIGESILDGCSGLESITVESGNKHYRSEGNCLIETSSKKLLNGCKNSVIPTDGSVTSIGNGAFSDCSSLTSIIIPDNITSIGDRAFSDCSALTSITIPDSVTSIGSQAFYHCKGLVKLTVGDGITTIGDKAFESCNSFVNIYFEGDVNRWVEIRGLDELVSESRTLYINGKVPTEVKLTTAEIIEQNAFRYCKSLTSVSVSGRVSFVLDFAFGSCSNLKDVKLNNGLTNICNNAFYGCSSLTNITIPDSVTFISGAFTDCINLKSVHIPKNVTYIGFATFVGCSSLENLTVERGNQTYHSNANCIIKTAEKTLVAGCKNSVIPTDGSVTNIGESAFSKCSGLTSITIPNSVTAIDNRAFSYCTNLKNITIPDSVTSLGYEVFSGCSGLVNVTIGNGVDCINQKTFHDCIALKSITVGSGMNTIDKDAFAYCYSLTSVYYKGTEREWNMIDIDPENYNLNKAVRYYYSETKPTEEGNYWHYVDGVVTVWA